MEQNHCTLFCFFFLSWRSWPTKMVPSQYLFIWFIDFAPQTHTKIIYLFHFDSRSSVFIAELFCIESIIRFDASGLCWRLWRWSTTRISFRISWNAGIEIGSKFKFTGKCVLENSIKTLLLPVNYSDNSTSGMWLCAANGMGNNSGGLRSCFIKFSFSITYLTDKSTSPSFRIFRTIEIGKPNLSKFMQQNRFGPSVQNACMF